jgi:hypothetical protein
MEEIEEKPSKIPRIDNILNYRDLLGEYPIIFGIKIISSLALVFVIVEFYNYHNPLDSLITKYAREPMPGFKPDPDIFVLWSFIAGFGFYIFTLFKGKYKFFLLLATIILLAQYISDPALDFKRGEHVIPTKVEIENSGVDQTAWKWKPIQILYDDVEGSEKRIDDAIIRTSNIIFGSFAFLGAFGIWKRKGWAIAGSIALAIIIGFLHSPNLCLESSDADFCGYEQKEKERTWNEYLASGIFIGMGFVIYIELSYAAIKYENYAEQFKPAGLDDSLLTDAQKKGVSRTLRTLFISYLMNLGVMLLITFTLAQAVINVNDYVSTSEGRIQDSVELQGPYGIVFTSLIFFMLLGFIRMFIGADYDAEDT